MGPSVEAWGGLGVDLGVCGEQSGTRLGEW